MSKKKELLKVVYDAYQNYYVIVSEKTPEVSFIEAENVFSAFLIKYHYEKWIRGEEI